MLVPVYMLHLLMLTTADLNKTGGEETAGTFSETGLIGRISSERRPIKLNTKQSLIMNQVVNSYIVNNAKNELCANHSREYKFALRSFEAWALKMFDSSSKLQSGIFNGNLMDFGSFQQCVHISADTDSGRVIGKHCTLKITPPTDVVKKVLTFRNISEKRFKKIRATVEGASIYWSVCLPESCPKSDILMHFTKLIDSVGEGLQLTVSLHDLDCYSLKDEPAFTYVQYISISIILSMIVITSIFTLMDMCDSQKSERFNSMRQIFSMYRNAQYVFRYDTDNTIGLNCLHGIRFLSICYVVLGHRFLMTLFVPAVNSLELMEWLLRYRSTIIIGGTVSVDTFFMISGLLVTYYTMKHLTEHNGKINWLLFYLHRFIRLTPPHAFAVLTVATLIQYIGSGPLWKKMSFAIQKPCQYFWWSAILHIQNYVNPAHICILQTWYLTNDFIYYTFSPILIYPLWRWKYFGWLILIISYVLSVVVNFYVAWINSYGAGTLVSNSLTSERYFTHHYITPHIRAATYIMGVGLGALLHKTKNVKIKMNPVTVTVGWLWSIMLILTTVLGNHPFQLENHDYNRLEHTIFISISRSAWTLGVMWIVWACKHGYGGPVNHFLSHPIFQVLGKLSYSIFLWHMPLQFLSNGALKLPLYFSDFSVAYKFIGDICTVTLFAVVYTVLYECPFVRLSQLFK